MFKKLIPLMIMLASTSVEAILIDNGSNTYDSDTSLAWLDLSETIGLSGSEALEANSGYRIAGFDDVSDLFEKIFNLDPIGLSDSMWYSGNPLENQVEKVSLFNNLFGCTRSYGGNDCASLGLYNDDQHNSKLMGSWDLYLSGKPFGSRVFYNYSTSNIGEVDTGGVGAGIFLVAKSAVPEPSTFWLFGLVLISTVIMRKKVS
ncbi:MAG: hypothetical protein ACJAS1_004307 [Oleiphilaceae bacterium]|jgi:hypothetical protein